MVDGEAGERVSREKKQVSNAMAREFDRTGLQKRLYEFKTWVMVDLNRWILIAALTVVVFAITVLVGAFGPASVQQYLLDGTSASDGYVELQTVTVTVATIALTINQLVLSPQLGPLSTQRRRLKDAVSHRTEIESSADVPRAPREPAQYLRTIVGTIRDRADRLARESETFEDGELRRRVREYTDRVKAESDAIARVLADQQFGNIATIGAAMHLDTSHDLAEARGLQNEYEEQLSDTQQKAFDDLVDIVEQFSVAEEYFHIVYIQMEFANFSHALLYTALPALLISHYTVNVLDPSTFPGTTLGIWNLLWFEAAAFAITVLPVLVLISYVARLSTLAKATAFVSPFSK